MKAIVRRYDANPESRFLEDRGGRPDPDFWSTVDGDVPLPVWSICGPTARAALEEGDVIVFTPMKTSVDGVIEDYEYVPTGVLWVDDIVSPSSFLRDGRVAVGYKRWYVEDLANAHHLDRDLREGNLDIAGKRADNVVIGNPERSAWFGRNRVSLRDLVAEAAGERQATSVEAASYQPERIHGDAALRLYTALFDRLDPVDGRPGRFAAGAGPCGTCGAAGG